MAELFPRPPRAKARVMMHEIDSGSRGPTDVIAKFACKRCGHESQWLICENWTSVTRGEPCPICNAAPASHGRECE